MNLFFLAFMLAGEVAGQSVDTTASQSTNTVVTSPFSCPVTISRNDRYTYGNDALSTTLWSLGVVLFTPEGPGTIYEDGSLGMKWHWGRLRTGTLTVKGRLLDHESPPMHVVIPAGYGDSGFQTTGLIFPTSGCWEVTGELGDARLTFTMLVIDVCEYGALCGPRHD